MAKEKISYNPNLNSLNEVLINVDMSAMTEFFTKVSKKVFFLRDTFITPRMYNQWRSEGLVSQPANPSERKWVSFHLRDYVWVKIVYDLRLMGCSVADIRKAKEICLQPMGEKIDEQTWEKALAGVIKSMRQKKQQSEAFINEAEKYLKINTYKQMLADKAEMNICMMDAAFLNIVSSGNDWNLYLFLPPPSTAQRDAIDTDVTDVKPQFKYTTEAQKRKMRQSGMEAVLFSSDLTKSAIGLNTDIVHSVPHIKIPIKHYLWDFLLDRTKVSQLGKLELLTAEEMRLLEEIRLGNKKEIIIKFKDGNIERIEIKKELARSAEKRIMEVIMNGEYCDISIKAQGGKIMSFQKTTKKKL